MSKKVLSVLLIVFMSMTLCAQFVGNQSFMAGKSQGKFDGQQDASWLLWGCAGVGCNIIAPVAAYFMPGDVPNERLAGKSVEYIRGYSDGYIKAKRWRQVLWAGAGMVVNSVLLGGGAASR